MRRMVETLDDNNSDDDEFDRHLTKAGGLNLMDQLSLNKHIRPKKPNSKV